MAPIFAKRDDDKGYSDQRVDEIVEGRIALVDTANCVSIGWINREIKAPCAE